MFGNYLVRFILCTALGLIVCVRLKDHQGPCKENEFDCEKETNGTRCIPVHWKCDQVIDCPATHKDEESCQHQKHCPEGLMLCDNGNCIAGQLKCDQIDDCGDGSDEEGCLGLRYQCPDEENWFRCTKGFCIPVTAKCDKTMDCPEGDDERGCPAELLDTTLICDKNEFQCDGRCVPMIWKCDGAPDCKDGTDETKEDCETNDPEEQMLRIRSVTIPAPLKRDSKSNCSLRKDSMEFQCETGRCIPVENVCDSKDDCLDGTDEGGSCGECLYMSCSHKCIDYPQGPQCWCPKGRHLSYDGQTCVDINECLTPEGAKCAHRCVNLEGSYRCDCAEKYILTADRHHCVAEIDPYASIFFSIGSDVLQLSYQSLENISTPGRFDHSWDRGKLIRSLSFNERLNSLYFGYGDIQVQQASLFVSKGYNQECLVGDLAGLVSIAVDWVTDNVYYTSQYPSHFPGVSVCTWNGRYCRLLVQGNSGKEYYDRQIYHGLVLNPSVASMFWIDMTGKMDLPRIMTSKMDGANVHAFIDTYLGKPQGLALDHIRQELYFCDTVLQMIFRINIVTRERIAIVSSQQGIRYPYEMLFFDDLLYWTDWNTRSLMAHKVDSPDSPYALFTALTIPYGLTINHTAYADRKVRNPCKEKECPHICVLSSDHRSVVARCMCPNSYVEQKDGRCININIEGIKVPTMCLQLRIQHCQKGTLCLNNGECWTKANSSGHIYDTECKCKDGFDGPFCDTSSIQNAPPLPKAVAFVTFILIAIAFALIAYVIYDACCSQRLFRSAQHHLRSLLSNLRNSRSMSRRDLLSEEQAPAQDVPGPTISLAREDSNVLLGVLPMGPLIIEQPISPTYIPSAEMAVREPQQNSPSRAEEDH